MKTKLGDIAYITKLAGYEHTKYIQGNISHCRDAQHEVPLFIGKTVRNGKIDEEYDWFLPSSISDLLPRSQLTKKCIVMPYVGSLGDLAIFYANERCHLGSNICKIELQKGCKYNEEFVYFFLKSPEGQARLFRDVQGAVQKNITMESIRNIELPDASEYTQRQIVACLSAIDAKIENNNAVCADLEGMAKLLYDYWFVQFDFPDENGKPYKSSGGKMVWNEVLKREIPEGWEASSFGECIRSINTGLNPRDNFKLNTGGNIRYLTVKNLTTTGNIDFTSCDYIDDAARDIVHKRSDVSVGDILFASIAPLGRCFLVDEPPHDWDINESVFSVRPNYERMTSKYLYMTFIGDVFIKQATNSSTGSIFKGIRVNDLLDMKTVVPPIFLLKAFDAKIESVFEMKSSCFSETADLASLRDFLLPMLMNGQVKVG